MQANGSVTASSIHDRPRLCRLDPIAARCVAYMAVALLVVAIAPSADACVWDKQTAESAAAAAPDVADVLAGRVVVPTAAYWQWRLDRPEATAVETAMAFIHLHESTAALRALNRLADDEITTDAIVLAAVAKRQWRWIRPIDAVRPNGTTSDAEAVRSAARFLQWDDLLAELSRRDARDAGVALRLWDWLVPTPDGEQPAGVTWLLLPDEAKLGQGWRMWGANDKPLIPNVPAGEEPTYEQTHREAADALACRWIDDRSSFAEIRAALVGILQRSEPAVLQGDARTGEPLFYALLGEWLAIEKLKPLAYRAYNRALDTLDALPVSAGTTVGDWRPRLREQLQRWMQEVKSSTRTDQTDFADEVIATERASGSAFRKAYHRYEADRLGKKMDPLEPDALATWKAEHLALTAEQQSGNEEKQGTPATPWVIAGIAALLAIWLTVRKGGG